LLPPRPARGAAVHIGGGYYTPILAELVGAAGRVTAIEFDAELGASATANFARTPHVRALHWRWHADHVRTRRRHLCQCRATRPADAWLERLKDGGRLILP
jgi:protein-L-isoaspartate(D-aspartate) O-methyltransferase